jgi:drug/metabolite transporter (DMT)-like permease
MNSERFRIWSAYFIVCTVWGSTWLAIKIGLETVPPFLAVGLRFAIASALLLGIIRVRGLAIPHTREAIRVYVTLGLLTFTFPFASVYWGEQFIPSGLCSILFSAYPIWVALFSHFLLKDEPLDVFKVLGIILGFAGLLIIFAGDVHWSDPRGFLGMLAVLWSTILQAYALVSVKKHGQGIDAFVMNFAGMSMCAVFLLCLSVLVEPVSGVSWNATAVGSIVYLGIFGSVAAFGAYYWLLKRIEAVYLSMTSFINPIVAVILGAIVLGETLAPSVFGGAALVLAGIATANGRVALRRFVTTAGPGSRLRSPWRLSLRFGGRSGSDRREASDVAASPEDQ